MAEICEVLNPETHCICHDHLDECCFCVNGLDYCTEDEPEDE